MEKHYMVFIVLAVCSVSVVFYYDLYMDYKELEQHYEWALELSKVTPAEREQIAESIHSQNLV